MTVFDGILTLAVLLLFAGFFALVYERQNGHIGAMPPEPTVRRQLEQCGYELATARQSVEVWRDLAIKRKAIIEELSEAVKKANE